MVVKHVAPLSVAKVAGVLYALMGLCLGALFSLIGMAGAFAFDRSQAPFPFPFAGLMFGVGAVIIMPIFYGIFGFIFSLIGAALYNLVAGWVGGVEVELQ